MIKITVLIWIKEQKELVASVFSSGKKALAGQQSNTKDAISVVCTVPTFCLKRPHKRAVNACTPPMASCVNNSATTEM